MKEDSIELFGIKCVRKPGLANYSGKLGEITILYQPDYQTSKFPYSIPCEYELKHVIQIYGGVKLFATGYSFDEVKKEVGNLLKKTIDDINLIKGRIL